VLPVAVSGAPRAYQPSGVVVNGNPVVRTVIPTLQVELLDGQEDSHALWSCDGVSVVDIVRVVLGRPMAGKDIRIHIRRQSYHISVNHIVHSSMGRRAASWNLAVLYGESIVAD